MTRQNIVLCLVLLLLAFATPVFASTGDKSGEASSSATSANDAELYRLMSNLQKRFPAYVALGKDNTGMATVQVTAYLSGDIETLKAENADLRDRVERLEAEQNNPTGVKVVRP